MIRLQPGMWLWLWLWLSSLCLLPATANAHSFGRVYNLPVPFWLYAWGAVAALAASFLIVGYFVSVDSNSDHSASRNISQQPWVLLCKKLRLVALAKSLSVAGLLLCIMTGLWGSNSPYGNFNMTFFWIIFILGFSYLTACIGNFYAAINPWQVLANGLDRLSRSFTRGRFSYPAKLSYWPALGLYMGFIWIELFGSSTPHSLAVLLCFYTAINVAGIALIGSRDWFRYCEFLSVFFRLIAKMAVLDYRPPDKSSTPARLRLRAPFIGLLESPASSVSLLLFILFMLSSTAYDGLRETIIWQQLYWVELYQAALTQLFAGNPVAAFPAMQQFFDYWQSFWLLASPFLYLSVYLLVIWLMRLLTGRQRSVKALALHFALPLLPIALVYNISHYYTLIQTQGIKIISLISDPFSFGWNLFGTAGWLQQVIVPDAATVWHVQVGLIVLGHIVSVYLSHLVALKVFANHRQAFISQMPMLVLMMLFTTLGLWILAQPIATGA